MTRLTDNRKIRTNHATTAYDLLMGNNQGTRRIYLAWSKDGRTWQPRRTPLVDPPPGTDQIALAVAEGGDVKTEK